MEKLVAVLGATGQTGKLIVQKLIEQDIQVRVLSQPCESSTDVW
jgi:uncharacterized protein YbjT (DUF2867 family)